MRLYGDYIIDTSSLTQAKRTYYAFDIAPSFWVHIDNLAKGRVIISIDKVYEEIKKGQDDLYQWTEQALGQKFFIDTDNDAKVFLNYKKLIEWASLNNQFTSIAKKEFSEYEEADPWVVAFALTNQLTIVSQEVYDANIKRKIPIPNVCHAFSVRHIDTFTLLRETKFNM